MATLITTPVPRTVAPQTAFAVTEWARQDGTDPNLFGAVPIALFDDGAAAGSPAFGDNTRLSRLSPRISTPLSTATRVPLVKGDYHAPSSGETTR